ncbi:PPP4R2-domain-containing protein [Amylostereum chailletii]|nr:PPP4R2-domain-containing protein [Amylostereum chailletii]
MSEAFEWSTEYDAILEKIASTDVVDTEWSKLRDIIKHKFDEQNIASFLADGPKLQHSSITPFSLRPSTSGGLKISPFPTRERNEANPNEAPKSWPSAQEITEVKENIHAQLDTFDGPPFTIQRLADLCARPREQYKALGKYLRAVDRAIYVTSTWNSFPPLPPQSADGNTISTTPFGLSTSSVPSTPLFSPIPFLHNDARRSKSRSPPPSPLVLNGIEGVPLDSEPRAIGLVDEMDDPSPGHLSNRPTALTSVTSIGKEDAGPMSLESRFVKGSEASNATEPETKKQKREVGSEDMVLDDQDGDKENSKA